MVSMVDAPESSAARATQLRDRMGHCTDGSHCMFCLPLFEVAELGRLDAVLCNNSKRLL